MMIYNSILLIDDDEDDQNFFLKAMGRINSEVKCEVQSDATIALERLENKEIVPELIFLDLNMPIMNGQQFLEEIKKRTHIKDIPIIICSTSNNSSTILLTKELGAYDFITKPDKIDSLVYLLKPFFAS